MPMPPRPTTSSSRHAANSVPGESSFTDPSVTPTTAVWVAWRGSGCQDVSVSRTAQRVLHVGALVAGIGLIAGCGGGGGSKTVASAQVEKGMKQSLSTSSAAVTTASCPDDVKAEKGATFTCTVEFSNGAAGKV